MKIYLVGGAVRDKLLGRPIIERDWVVVGAEPQELISQGYIPVGKDFPVFLHPTTREEYALARTERKSGRGYKGFNCYAAPDVTLEQDLARRDLTINAIAEAEDGTLIDPYQGQQHLKQRLLQHVSPAFVEDPLRVLRVARFAARYANLGFKIAPVTQQLMRAMVRQGEVAALTPERVWQECVKALAEPHPEYFFQVLRNCGALKVIFPEIDCLFGIPASPAWHPEIDTGLHTLLALQQAVQAEADVATRFAVLMHDLGKGLTPMKHWPKHHGHDEAGVAPIKTVCQRLRTPNDYTTLAILVARFHILCHKVHELTPQRLVKLLEQLDAFRKPERLQQFIIACTADAKGRLGKTQDPYPAAAYLQQAYQLVSTITHRHLIDTHLTGAAIGEAIRQERVRILEAWRNPS